MFSIKKLKEYNELYRNGIPEISDEAYDHMYRELKKYYPEDPFFDTVQGLTDSFNQKTKLDYVMGSLRNYHCYPDKTIEGYKKADDIETFLHKYNDGSGWVVMDKIDGLSVMVTWENGSILKAELRGEDGVIGCDVTDKVRIILKNIKIAPEYEKLVLRGEIVLGIDDPTIIGYKNRRNGAVGILKRENLKHVEHLSIYFYEIVDVDTDLLAIALTVSESLSLIQNLGLNAVSNTYLNNDTFANISSFIKSNMDKYGFHGPHYDIDGRVICSNDYFREDVKLPNGKVAIKPESLLMETVVRKIEYNTSRNGYAVPRVEYDPVEYNGATLSSATAFNCGFVTKNQLGIGSKILVSRAQEVVPKIEAVIESNGYRELISCQSCGNELVWDVTNVHKVCINLNCPAQVLKNITHYFITLGLEEFGETQISKLNVDSIFDIYELTVSDILKIDGFGDKSANDLVRRIQETKNTKPAKLLQALGIPLLGKTLSKLLVQNFSWDQIINASFTVDELTRLDGIGEVKAISAIRGLKRNSHILTELFEIGVSVNDDSSGALTGKVFCITGKLSEPRKHIEKIIEDYGGEISSIKSVNGMTLVCNEKSSSSKYKKAEKMGIPIITEEQLYIMCL